MERQGPNHGSLRAFLPNRLQPPEIAHRLILGYQWRVVGDGGRRDEAVRRVRMRASGSWVHHTAVWVSRVINLPSSRQGSPWVAERSPHRPAPPHLRREAAPGSGARSPCPTRISPVTTNSDLMALSMAAALSQFPPLDVFRVPFQSRGRNWCEWVPREAPVPPLTRVVGLRSGRRRGAVVLARLGRGTAGHGDAIGGCCWMVRRLAPFAGWHWRGWRLGNASARWRRCTRRPPPLTLPAVLGTLNDRHRRRCGSPTLSEVCRRGDSNPHGPLVHLIGNKACLPIPPRRHGYSGWQVSNLRHRDLRSRVLPLNYTPIFSRARTADSWRAGSPRRSHGISEDSDIGPYLRCRDVGRPHEHGNSTVIKVHVQHSSAARNRLLERHATEYPIWHRSSNELSENRDNFPT